MRCAYLGLQSSYRAVEIRRRHPLYGWSETVLAVVTRSRTDSEPQCQNALKCEEWEVVVPELVFQRAG